jgi:uracil-DNA glycosylase
MCSIKDLIPTSWKDQLAQEFEKPYFKELDQRVQTAYQTELIFPRYESIFKIFELVKLEDIKVCIIGQDCYQNPGFATGMAFSIPKTQSLPPSLVNIYKELSTDLDIKTPEHGDLTAWAKQGVFLLNTTLTVKIYESNSHKDFGWEIFTDAILNLINEKCKNVVFMLWGSDAKRKAEKVDSNKHLLLTSVHPSPYSADKGFFGCKHFSKCNKYLQENDKSCINWEI